MVDADSYYGEFLKAEDIKQDAQVSAKAIKPEIIDNETKLVAELNELTKKLVLNKTNKDRLKEQFGTSETDAWLNKPFTLTTEQVQYKGEMVPALRVRKKPKEAAEKPAAPAQSTDKLLDKAVFG